MCMFAPSLILEPCYKRCMFYINKLLAKYSGLCLHAYQLNSLPFFTFFSFLSFRGAGGGTSTGGLGGLGAMFGGGGGGGKT